MFSRISKLITDELEENQTIKHEERELYEYGFRQGFTALLNIFTTLAIGLLFGCLLQNIAFLVFYIPLRSFAGGYHAKTPLRCYFQSIVMLLLVSMGFKYIELGILSHIIILLSSCIIIIFSPIEDSNKPLDETEIAIYKKRTVAVLLVELVFYITLEVVNWDKYSAVFTYVLGMMSLMLLFGKIKNDACKSHHEKDVSVV